VAVHSGFLALLTLTAGLAAACAPAAPAPAPVAPAPQAAYIPERAPAQTQPSEGKPGGILVYAQQSAVFNLHPWKGDIQNARAFSGVYEPLVRYDHREGVDFRRDREIKPGLAERWETVDPTTYVFHLRKNAKWHDGKPVTADDVVYSALTWMDPKEAPEPNRSAGELVAGAERIDDHTAKITLKRPSSDWLGMHAYQRNVWILPKHVEDQAKTMVGSGPFRVVKVDPNSALIMERNPDFHTSGRPFLDGAKVYNGMERASQQAAFIAKEMDLINATDLKQHDALKQVAPDSITTSYLQTHGNSLYMKQDRPPFSDIRVRRAAHLAVDREGLLKTVTFGAGVVNPPGGLALHGFSIPKEELQTLPGWRQPKDQDLAEAKRLLAEAGYPEGFKLNIQTDRDLTGAVPILTAVAPQLKAAGIDAQIMLLERAVFVKNQRDGDYEAWLATGHTDPPAAGLTDLYHSRGRFNQAGIKNPTLDGLIEEAGRLVDKKKSDEVNQKIQRVLLENHYTVPMVELPAYAFWQPWLHNYGLSFSAQPYINQWDNVWIDLEKAPKRTLQ